MKGDRLVATILGFVICIGIVLAVYDASRSSKATHSENAQSAVQSPTDSRPASFEDLRKGATEYAAQNNDEGVLTELSFLSKEDLNRPEIQKLYKAATKHKALKSRSEYAEAFERQLLTQGEDATVRATGKDADTLVITYVLTNRATVYQTEINEPLNMNWKQLGFHHIRMSDGFDHSWSFNIQ